MKAATSGSFAARLRQRQRKDRRSRLIVLGVVGIIVALGLVGWAGLVWSPWFRVEQGSANTDGLLTSEKILQAAALPRGEALVMLDTDEVRQRVEAIPEVASATVERRFPNTVAITVTEREAVYCIAKQNGCDWVDASGTIFHTAEPSPPDLPRATIAGDDQRLRRDVATVVHWIPPDVLTHVKQVKADAVDNIILDLGDQRTVMWGSAADSELKSEVIGLLMQNQPDVTTYDISAPTHPTTR